MVITLCHNLNCRSYNIFNIAKKRKCHFPLRHLGHSVLTSSQTSKLFQSPERLLCCTWYLVQHVSACPITEPTEYVDMSVSSKGAVSWFQHGGPMWALVSATDLPLAARLQVHVPDASHFLGKRYQPTIFGTWPTFGLQYLDHFLYLPS